MAVERSGRRTHRTHRTHRTRRWIALTASLALATMVVGCGARGPGGDAAADPISHHRASASAGSDTGAGTGAEADTGTGSDGDIALVVTDEGLAGVPVGSSTPAWVQGGAVAAPDGSAAFSVKNGLESAPGRGDGGYELIRIDPSTGGAETVGGQTSGPADMHVAAVEPGGGRVALAVTTTDPERTTIVDFDTAKGAPVRQVSFDGRLEPEAYSLDRTLLFAARIYDDRYHVHGLELASGEQWPTLGPDKTTEPEDMYGSVVQAVLSPDGTQLATLYRDSVKPEHTAFVHLLSLVNGTTVCIDLQEPFGGTEPGRDAIEWRDDGTVAVGHRADDPSRSTTATFDPAAIWSGDPQPHYHADARPDPSPPALPDGVVDTPGFQRFVALAAVRP